MQQCDVDMSIRYGPRKALPWLSSIDLACEDMGFHDTGMRSAMSAVDLNVWKHGWTLEVLLARNMGGGKTTNFRKIQMQRKAQSRNASSLVAVGKCLLCSGPGYVQTIIMLVVGDRGSKRDTLLDILLKTAGAPEGR
jgi:hypothetical protein